MVVKNLNGPTMCASISDDFSSDLRGETSVSRCEMDRIGVVQ